MKVRSLISLLFPLAVASVEMAVDADSTLEVRELKGSKSKGGGDCPVTKCIGPEFCSGGCQQLTFLAQLKDIEAEASNSTVQFINVPLYQKGKGCKGKEEVGSLVYTSVDPGDGSSLLSGAMTFNKNTAITFTGLINSKFLPVTGGTGKVKCGSGAIGLTVKNKKIQLDTNVCSLC